MRKVIVGRVAGLHRGLHVLAALTVAAPVFGGAA